MEVLANPTTSHAAGMTDLSWLGTFGGVIVSSLITIVIFCINLHRSNSLAAQERKRHEEEISRLQDEAEKTESRHLQQVEAMLAQGRRQREVAFLQELSDYLLELSSRIRSSRLGARDPSIVRLRQYGLKMYADFPEDDPAFSENVSRFLYDLATKVVNSYKGSGTFGEQYDEPLLESIWFDAEKAAFHLLRWLNPDDTQDAGQAFDNYCHTGEFEQVADTTK